MVIIDKFMRRLGYSKSRVGEIMGGGMNTSLFGVPQRFNYAAYLKGYADEAWVYACVYTIANAIAELPYRLVHKKIQNGKEEKELVDLPDVRKLFEKPNTNDENSTWYNLMEVTTAGCELTGNWYWLKDEIQTNGTPKSLQYLISSRVTPIPGNRKSTQDTEVKFLERYDYLPPGVATAIKLTPEEVLHFKYMNPSDYYLGLAPFAPGRFAIETIKESVKTNLNIFKNGAKLDGVIETDQILTKPVYERLKKEFDQKYKGVDKAHQTALLEQGTHYKTIASTMKDLEFIKGMKLNREEVCAVFGVPPLLVQILDKASYANYKESIKIFYQLTIIPKLHKFEPIITSIVKLFDKEAYFEFDLSQIEALKEEEKLKAETAHLYFSMGVPFNVINSRLNLGFEEIPGGNTGYLPIALIPAGSIPQEIPAGERSVKTVKIISEERKAFLWKQFDLLTRRIMKSYMKIIGAFFSKQEAEMLSRLGKDLEHGEYKLYPIKLNIEAVLFNEKGEVTKWAAESKKIHTVAVEENGKRELLNIGSQISFDVTNPRVVRFLDAYGLDKAESIMSNLKDEVKRSLIAGVEAGEGIPELKNRINHTYGGFKGEGWRATRIARTEVIGASNQGALEAYEQSEVVERKGWLSSHLPDAREDHLIMEGRKSIPIGDDFVLPSGASCGTPGQTGDPAEDINCACSIFAIIKED